jgi:hypothetical protein
MRILCFTPLHPDYGIYPQALAGIMALQHDDMLDIHFSQGDNPFAGPYENVMHQHNKARQMVLAGDYDALLSVEADMIVPPDTIGRLIDCDADIAYGLYIWRHKLKRWSAYTTMGLWGGESVSLNHNGSGARESWGKIIDVDGLGMGCTLISRETLEHLPFRLHDGKHSWLVDEYADDFKTMGISPYKDLRGMMCDDWLFSMDAKHYGLTQRANLGLVCGHIDGDSVLWPDPNAEKFYRLEPIKEPAGAGQGV